MNRILIVLLSLNFVACVNDDTDKEKSVLLEANQYPQKWELVSMSGMIANVPPTRGSEMAWQEFYILEADRTFIKSRDIDGATRVATGIYEIVELEDGKYLHLSYESDNVIIANCSSIAEEYLRFETPTSLIGTWWAYDGPGLFYERIQ